jgi:G6PDH family F420-dependent oxidoreductase
VTGVTCPFFRYHPAVIAQAAATVALLSDGRFTLGIGAGERLNEHVVGRPFPAVRIRHEMLREALEIIRLLWQGGYQSYDGSTCSSRTPASSTCRRPCRACPVAAGGPQAARLAAELGDGLFATEPRADLVEASTARAAADRCTARRRWPGRPTRTPRRRRCSRPPAGRSPAGRS